MKIVIDISQIVYKGTGVSNYTLNLVSELLKIDPRSIYLFGTGFGQFRALSDFSSSVADKNQQRSYIFPIPLSVMNFVWNELHVLRIERLVGSVDCLHTSDWLEPPSQCRKITTIHDLVVFKYPELSDPAIVKTQMKKLKWVQQESDTIITDSYSTKTDIINILKIPEEKIAVVYPGIDAKFKIASPDEIEKVRVKYKIKGNYFLSVGTMEPRKNIRKVIEAYKLFKRNFGGKDEESLPELLLAGNQGWGEEIRSLSDHIRILGYIQEEDLVPMYSGATAFVYPSLYEGFGLPILEAFKCGTPVITSGKGSIKEVAGDAALYANPLHEEDICSKMLQIWQNKELQNKLRNKGSKQCVKFSWEKTANEIYKIYTSQPEKR